MRMLTKKQIYDKVAKHLLSQRARSMTGGRCVYRNPQGLKCAIGCLIPDSDYTKDIEGGLVDFAVFDNDFALLQILYQNGVDVSDIKVLALLGSLLNIHDQMEIDEWALELKEIKKEISR